ncbi:hypothetical protein BDA96_05G181000 [Sorghum bicolor]|uniref:Uncharacterized protein n=1 Tax=Sorghum bicolor TaxID=4558 RepID=A0A921QY11_SORBI|nr:hypothetical protein BDA96_05G181000 [Sorghum bicolor]
MLVHWLQWCRPRSEQAVAMVLGQWGCADFPMGVRRLWFSFPVFIWITGYPLDGALVKFSHPARLRQRTWWCRQVKTAHRSYVLFWTQ